VNHLLFAAAILGPAAVGDLSAMEPWGPRPPSPRPPEPAAPRTPPSSEAAVARARAEAKRRRRQRERRRVSLGGLPIWIVGTPGEYDWELVAARTERQAMDLYVDHAGLTEWEVGDLTVKRAEWDRAVEHEPIVTEAKVLHTEMSHRLPTGELARFGWGFRYDGDPECEECNEHVESVQELATPQWVIAVCRECYAQLGGAS
jgi:hypothetical protein